jgi:hypothetical protein
MPSGSNINRRIARAPAPCSLAPNTSGASEPRNHYESSVARERIVIAPSPISCGTVTAIAAFTDPVSHKVPRMTMVIKANATTS